MSRERLGSDDLTRLTAALPGWAASESLLEKTFTFPAYGDGVAFAVAVSIAAERRDHHPDLFVGYRRVRVGWATHDAGGTTRLDEEMARETEAIAGRHGAEPPVAGRP